ncbi:MAG: hypothetical protein U5K54_05650 [Cytophagales bacterium]|nr:hypothetical protein [Cytophagales bacterium]
MIIRRTDSCSPEFPTEAHHGWKYIAFGPDGKLYIPVGAPCNICESEDPIFAAIHRMNADGTGLEIIGQRCEKHRRLCMHPETKDIWFTDNGRDMLGDDIPPVNLIQLQVQGCISQISLLPWWHH